MKTKNDGGPAFPCTGKIGEVSGASMRDWFAAKALNALLGGAPRGTSFGVDHMDTNMNYALASYAMADAMLAAREHQQ